MELLIQNENNYEIDNYINNIEKAIKTVLKVENEDDNCEVSLTFVDNEEIKSLNKTFRKIDSVTDVLSFPLDDEIIEDTNRMLGDIVISYDKCLEQAKEFGHSFERELIYLIVHSMLHLLGYDHMDEDEKLEMRTKEKVIMKELKLYKEVKI